MKTKLTLSLLLLTLSSIATAKSIYITDSIDVQLKAGERNSSKTLKTYSSGTALTFISKHRSGYTKVKMPNGHYAFIQTRYTMNEPPEKVVFEQAVSEAAKLKEENIQIKAELETLKGDNTVASSTNEVLSKEREQLSSELAEIRYTAANAIKLKEGRDKLQADVIQLTKELEQIKLEKKTLETSANQDWFLYGGILSLFGVLLGFILPKLSWRRKANNWDSSFH